LEYSINPWWAYQTLKSFRIKDDDSGVHVVVNVTTSMRAYSTSLYLRLRQTSSFTGRNTEAWAVDNFSVLKLGSEFVIDDFDPISPCFWLAHTGTTQPLNSSGNALTFSGVPVSSTGHFVTSVPLAIQDSRSVSRTAKVLFEENFDPSPYIPGRLWASIQGGDVVVPDCGRVDWFGTGTAAFFNQSGSRYIQTQPLDLTLAQTLSFLIQIGGGRGCEEADVGEDVVVEYQLPGSSSFTELQKMAYNEYAVARDIVIALPSHLRSSGTVLQWRQIAHSDDGLDEWILDKVQITNIDEAVTTRKIVFSDDFSTDQPVPGLNWREFLGGSFVYPNCFSFALDFSLSVSSYRVAMFNGTGIRQITTQPLDLSSAKSLIFQVILGSGFCRSVASRVYVMVEYRDEQNTYYKLLRFLSYDGMDLSAQSHNSVCRDMHSLININY
jgi:hypothetical protein